MKNFHEISKNNKIALWGYWQANNGGDMWILENLKKRFPGIIPINTEEENFNDYDFVIIGGGGLINYSIRPSFNNIKTKYATIGLGGEFEIKDKEDLVKLINRSVLFGVRDTRNLQTFHIENNLRMKLSGDCTFLYPLEPFPYSNKLINNIKLIWRDPFRLMMWDKSKHHQEDGQELNELFREYLGDVPTNDNLKCLEMYRNILSKHGNVEYDSYVIKNFSFRSMYAKFKNVDLVVSMRLHGVIAAIQLGIPCIALDIYPKVRTVMQECGLEDYCIKLSEYYKINDLINNINKYKKNIVNKMNNYTNDRKRIINSFANELDKKIIYLLKNKI